MSCSHSVLESVEFAEGDSFLYSPNANHHIEGFDIVGRVVLWVVDLFHIPYQIYSAKIEKPSAFHNGEGLERKTSQSFLSERQRCKYSEYEWKNKVPARNVEQGVHIIWAVVMEKEQPFPLVGYLCDVVERICIFFPLRVE